MLIDVTNLVKGQSMAANFVETFDFTNGDKKVGAEVEVNGDLSKIGEEYIFNGKIIAVLSLNCDLCLNAYKTKLSCDMSEIYSKDSNPDKEIWTFSDKTIDLKPAVITNILLSMPMKAVCSDDCKGLCPTCGHNLNEGDCDCDIGYVNPTFEKLLNLFNDKEV